LVCIGVVAMGEMGSAIAGRLVERGARVVTSVQGRSAQSSKRAAAVGAEILDDETLVDQADILLSIVPPSAASATAERFYSEIVRTERRPIFIDCNAIAPQTLDSLAKPFLAADIPFADASIIGVAPRPGYSPRIYLSGPLGSVGTILEEHGLDCPVLSDRIGDASALKMSFAGVTKGFQALATAMALGAARAGSEDHFRAELERSLPELYGWLCKMLPVMYAKAHRWDDEMREIATFLKPEQGAEDMLLGAAVLYRHVAEDARLGACSEIVSTLDRFVQKPS
jgi:putative dehydrogenase